MTHQATKHDLIKSLQFERGRIEAMLNGLNEDQMQQAGVQGRWSVKDIVAHLTTWECRGIEWIRSLARAKKPEIPVSGYTWDDVDQLNAETYEENRDRPLAEILTEFGQSFTRLLKLVQSLKEEDLEHSFEAYWTNGEHRTLRDIVAWRYLHYRSHGENIEAWLDSLKQGWED